jgi:hypothetical protein
MNAYQKATLLITLVVLPLIVLFAKGMGYPHVEVVGFTAIALAGGVIYALRAVRPSRSTD